VTPVSSRMNKQAFLANSSRSLSSHGYMIHHESHAISIPQCRNIVINLAPLSLDRKSYRFYERNHGTAISLISVKHAFLACRCIKSVTFSWDLIPIDFIPRKYPILFISKYFYLVTNRAWKYTFVYPLFVTHSFCDYWINVLCKLRNNIKHWEFSG